MAPGTKAALSKTAAGIGTEAGDGAVTPVGTVIERTAKAACLLKEHMATDLLGNGGAIPSKSPADLLKGSRVIKHGFDSNTFIKG